ncbi:MAG: nucleotidyltransferase family protein [Kiritimatiellia bacterium]|jgi:NDP-sugar pyrophosphorylase family protein
MKSLVVLAAGMGSRYGGLKQMDPVGPKGEFILDYSVDDALDAGFSRIVFVIRRDIEKDFRDIVGRKWEAVADVRYAMQDLDDLPPGFSPPPDRVKPWGTAHAVLAARRIVTGSFAVVNADDFYGAEAFRLNAGFLDATASEPYTHCMVAYRLDKTLSKFGGVSRGICTVDGDGMLVDIRERLALQRGDDGVVRDGDDAFPDDTLVSMNMFGFKRSYIDMLEAAFPAFLKANVAQPKAEFQVPTALGEFLRAGRVKVKVLRTESEWFGITCREDRVEVVEHLKKLKKK